MKDVRLGSPDEHTVAIGHITFWGDRYYMDVLPPQLKKWITVEAEDAEDLIMLVNHLPWKDELYILQERSEFNDVMFRRQDEFGLKVKLESAVNGSAQLELF